MIKKMIGLLNWGIVSIMTRLKLKGNITIGRTASITCISKLSTKCGGRITIADKCGMEQCEIVALNDGEVVIGERTTIASGFLAVSHKRIQIGKHCSIAPNVTIYDHDHIFNKNGIQPGFKTSEVTIGDNVWIGTGVIILKGTEIGDNCVIGAGTVLQGKIPNNSLVKYGRDITVKAIDWE